MKAIKYLLGLMLVLLAFSIWAENETNEDRLYDYIRANYPITTDYSLTDVMNESNDTIPLTTVDTMITTAINLFIIPDPLNSTRHGQASDYVSSNINGTFDESDQDIILDYLDHRISTYVNQQIVGNFHNQSVDLVNISEDVLDYLRYEMNYTDNVSNLGYGSMSYMDDTLVNQNMYLRVCHPSLRVGQLIDLGIYSESFNLYESLLITKPTITETNGSDCSLIDVDISSIKSIFPGNILASLYVGNERYPMSILDTFMNGSYKLTVNVDGRTRHYYLGVEKAYDELGRQITRDSEMLLMSVLNSTGDSVTEQKISASNALEYNGTFKGGETVWVNGIPSLEIKVVNPCDEYNESGYYLINASSWNINRSCINIEGKSNIVLNFGDRIIDGDGLENGSMANGTCAVTVKNSMNITLEDWNVQQFFNGVCLFNSTVNIIGKGGYENIHGIYITNRSKLILSSAEVFNIESDISADTDSLVELYRINFSTARINAKGKDIFLSATNDTPEPPGEGLHSIGQYLTIRNQSGNSWVVPEFLYDGMAEEDKIAEANISIYKLGERKRGGVWVRTNWTQVYTVIIPSESKIVGGNVTDFSVFAPFGERITDPEPFPQPNPTPDPQVGAGSGEGGSPASTGEEALDFTEIAEILLELFPDNITLQQGESGSINFNLTNLGDKTATGITIVPDVPSGWDYLNYSIGMVGPYDMATGEFTIAPYENEKPRMFKVPVDAYVNIGGKTVSIAYDMLTVYVTARDQLSRVKILEYTPFVTVKPNEKINVSFFVQNIGDQDLENISVKIVSEKNCLQYIEGSHVLDADEKKTITFEFQSTYENLCEAGIQFYSNDKLIGFVPMRIATSEKTAFQELVTGGLNAQILLLIILVIWSMITVYVLVRKLR
ncbi:DUF11 domain-containing protein [Candidatus Woesearchaeota archaeon]|nr:DUF11 domain-containing protein [Candidatus Woesearchaeota archaeon]